MRILFTCAGGSGHLEPLIAIAHAASAAGHQVAFACRPWMVPKAEAFGFTCFAAGPDTGLTPVRRPLTAVDMEHEIRAIGGGFASRIARERAADLVALCAHWQPDVLVCEELDFGAMIAAERCRLPFASVLVIASGALVRADVVSEPLNSMRADYDLAPDPDLTMLSRHLVLSPFPPSYRDPAFPLPATAYSIHPLIPEPSSDAPIPAWLNELPDRPTIYFTLGTVFNVESGDLFQRVLTGLRDLPINLIVTVGHDIDPAELGAQPANVYIERYIPQAVLLPRCAMVVSHGGSGSVIGALAHGLPMVLLPMGADQPLNAQRCEALGVARSLDVMTASASTIHDTVLGVLNDPVYRRAAECPQAEIAALPDATTAVTALERLVT
ncbi:MAG: glycosyltransferase family 1 protein [Anaerolineae bacterium]|nr:glycosyltransferase family 1 protein [Anaerolineae bacterium]